MILTVQETWRRALPAEVKLLAGRDALGRSVTTPVLMRARSPAFPGFKGGELAITYYRVLRRHGDKSLLELTLETGRKNQVRVQLAALGHPIIGDRKYGARTDPARRLALHSCDLKFRHPVSGAPMAW